jgi:hypothetical protein
MRTFLRIGEMTSSVADRLSYCRLFLVCLCPSRPVVDLFSMALPPHLGPMPLIHFRNHFSQTVGLLERVFSPSQGPLPKHRTTQPQNKRIHTHTPNINALSGVRTHDPSVRASEDSSCLRPRGYCDRPSVGIMR